MTMDSVKEELEDIVPKLRQVKRSHSKRRKPATEPSTIPTIVPGSGPDLTLP
jgi:hypothetical protein